MINLKRIFSPLVISLLLITTSLSANTTNKWYFGTGVYGESKINSGVTSGTASLQKVEKGWKLYTGYKINRYFSLEAFYLDFGEATVNGNIGDSFSFKGQKYSFIENNSKLIAQGKTYGVSSVATYPFHKYFEPFAKLGIQKYDIQVNIKSTLLNISASDSGTDLMYGIGFDSNISDNFAFRIELEKHKLDINGDIDFTSISLIYKF